MAHEPRPPSAPARRPRGSPSTAPRPRPRPRCSSCRRRSSAWPPPSPLASPAGRRTCRALAVALRAVKGVSRSVEGGARFVRRTTSRGGRTRGCLRRRLSLPLALVLLRTAAKLALALHGVRTFGGGLTTRLSGADGLDHLPLVGPPARARGAALRGRLCRNLAFRATRLRATGLARHLRHGGKPDHRFSPRPRTGIPRHHPSSP